MLLSILIGEILIVLGIGFLYYRLFTIVKIINAIFEVEKERYTALLSTLKKINDVLKQLPDNYASVVTAFKNVGYTIRLNFSLCIDEIKKIKKEH